MTELLLLMEHIERLFIIHEGDVDAYDIVAAIRKRISELEAK